MSVVYAWCSQEDDNNNTEELAKKFHNCMAPIQFPYQDPFYAELPSVSAKISATSSQFRMNFCKSVSESASTAYSHTLEKVSISAYLISYSRWYYMSDLSILGRAYP